MNNKKANALLGILGVLILIGVFVVPFFYIYNLLAPHFLAGNPTIPTQITFILFPVFIIAIAIYYFIGILRGGGM
jgi:Gpi18-like mannosyltransferase